MKMKKIKTCFQEIDDILNTNNGEGKLISLGARPGMGKTTFVMNLAKNIAKLNDVKILFFSLEESKEKLEVLFFQNLRCAPQEFSKIYIDETPAPSIDYIEKAITQFDNPAIVIIDYIALINGYTVGLENEILCKLKSICKNKNVSIIYTCQLSRNLEKNIDKRPYLDSFDNVVIRNSDAIFALYRPAYYYGGNDSTAELRLMKNLTGGVCLIPLLYDEENRSFNQDVKYQVDSAPKKLVELHVNTKKSDCISTIDVSDVFEFANNCNHEAIAFTNLNNVQDFPEIARVAEQYENIKAIYGMCVYYEENGCGAPSITLLAKNQEGIKELYKIVSTMEDIGSTKVTYIEDIESNRDNLLCGATGDSSDLFWAVSEDKPFEELVDIAFRYDYFEIFPTYDIETRRVYKKIVDLGEKLDIPVVATGNCHCCGKDGICRDVIKEARGYRYDDEPMYLRNTEDMLKEFAYLGKEKAYEIVVKNTNLIADMIEKVSPISENAFDLMLPDADNKISTIATEKAHSLYGDILPKEIEERLMTEFGLIRKGKYASRYLIAHYLTEYAKQKGYPTSSTGTAGSSFVAFLLGITEINPLKPHYLCNECKRFEFAEQKIYTGYDLPYKKCPVCGSDMRGDGHDIPFESFMGLVGDKVPDISLCFPISVRHDIINHLCSIVGKDNLAFAKAVYGITEPKAERYISMYEEITQTKFSDSERIDIICQMQGTKCEEKIHSAGILVLPVNKDFLSYSPLETYSVKDCLVDKITHLDFNDLHNIITKFNILGYRPLEQLRLLEKHTGISTKEMDINSPELYQIFKDSHILGMDIEEPATLGLPDFGNRIIRDMLKKTNPESFGDLIKIVGLSHGTGIWFHNAESLIEKGDVTIKDIAATREDVFDDLLSFGVEKELAFNITEKVRKGILGYTINDDNELKNIGLPENHNVPQWYIDFLVIIKYLFPKSHAVEYVRLALTLAWYKIHYPTEFYATYFEVYMKEEKYDFLPLGFKGINMHLDRIRNTLGVGRKYVEEMEKMKIFQECFFRDIKFVYRKVNDSATYIPTKENIIIINRNNIY